MAKKFLSVINVTNLASDPISATDGDIYYNTTTDQLRVYANGSWTNIAGSGSLPSQTGNSGKYLTTNGSSSSWDTIDLGTDTVGNYVAQVTGSGNGISITGSGESASVVISNTGVTSLAGTTNEVEVSASTGSITIGLPATGVSANTYGSSSQIPVITIDANGRITSATTVGAEGGGGGGGNVQTDTYLSNSWWLGV